MPELPEVENARRLIAEHALGRRIADVDDSDSYVLRPHPPGELKSALTGRRLTAAHRRGKTMWVETSGTSDGPAADEDAAGPEVGLHLGMSGRIVVTGPDGTVIEAGDPYRYGGRGRNPVWSRFTLSFADGGSLVLLDPRRLGRVWLNPAIGALGPDATEVTFGEFRALITKGTIAVKARLLDQSKIAGVGNLLADEILWQARVSPLISVSQLTPAQVKRLYEALTGVVAAAIAHGGAHTGEIIAQRRPGGTCPRDGAPMAHGVVGGRSTWWCSREQALRPARRGRAAGSPKARSPKARSPKAGPQ